MSNDRIRGLSLQFTTNDTEIVRGISNIKASIRELNQTFRTSVNNLKFDTKNTENYEKSIGELTNTIKIQKQNLESLKEEYEEVAKEKGENSRQAIALRQEYNKQADNINYLESQLKSAREEYAKFTEQQRIANSNWTVLGTELRDAGKQLQSFGNGMQSVGNKLTTYITAPVLGAVAALGSLTAGMGVKRLMDQDTAMASLRGRGMSEEEVDSVMKDVVEGVTGGMATRAQGTRIASGALAAGIEQGEDLQNYIRLVDSFAAGSGRSHDDSAMIFNRIVGSRKLMTQELNMIEQAMPGFERTMSESLGVTQASFREMVTAGEVSSEQFLEVMQGFAGGMAEEYAKTLPGMMSNIRANIGILGEGMMEGVYEQVKEVSGEFLELLRSPELRQAARDFGEILGGALAFVIDKIRQLINWWNEADDGTKKFAIGAGALVVALGPLLTVLGTGIVIFGKVVTAMGAISVAVGKAGSVVGLLAKGFTSLLSPLRIILRPLATIATRVLGITTPIGIAVTVLTALGSGFYLAYTRSETFREMIDGLIESIKNAWEWIVTFKDGIVDLFQGDLEGATDIFESLGLSEETIETIQGWAASLIESFESLKTTVTETFEGLKESLDRIWTALGTIFTNVWNSYIKPALDWLTEGFESLMEYLGIEMPSLDQLISGAFSSAQFSIDVFSGVIEGLLETAERVFEGVADALESISEGDWEQAWQDIKDMFGDIGEIWSGVWEDIKESFGEHFGNTIDAVKQWAIDLWNKINEWFNKKSLEVTGTLIGWYLSVLEWWDNLKSNVSTKTQELWDGVKTWFVTKSEEIVGTIRSWVGSLVTRFNRLKRDGIQAIKDLWEKGKEWFGKLKDDGIDLAEKLIEGAVEWFDELPDKMKSALEAAGNWITNMGANLAARGQNLGIRIANGVIGGLNKFIGGVNWVAEKLGLNKNLISEIGLISFREVPAYSKGTKFHKGGLALVGDKGVGNGGSGIADKSVTRELIRLPDKTEYLADGNLLLDLPTGTQVFSNKDTEEEMKKRVFGADVGHGGSAGSMLENMLKTITRTTVDRQVNTTAKQIEIGNEIVDWVGDVWDYMSNPYGLVKGMIDRIGYPSFIPSEALQLVKGAVGKLISSGTDYVRNLFAKSSVVDGGHILGKSVSHPFGRYNARPGSILYGKPHYGIDTRHNYDTLRSPIVGRISNQWYDRMGGNMIQITQPNGLFWWFAHMSSFAKNTGTNVKPGDVLGRTGNTGSFTTGPHLHTQVMKGRPSNSTAFDPMPLLKGQANSHRNGGFIESDGLFNLHANEMVIPLNNPTYAMKLIALAGQKLAGKSKQTSELPNVNLSNDKVVEELVKQNSILMKMLEKLTGIEAKDPIDLKTITKAQNRYKDDRILGGI